MRINDYAELYAAIGREFCEKDDEETHFRVPRTPIEAQGIRNIICTGKPVQSPIGT